MLPSAERCRFLGWEVTGFDYGGVVLVHLIQLSRPQHCCHLIIFPGVVGLPMCVIPYCCWVAVVAQVYHGDVVDDMR